MTFKFLTIQYEWKYIGWSQRTVHHTQWRKTQMTVDFSSDSYDQETMEWHLLSVQWNVFALKKLKTWYFYVNLLIYLWKHMRLWKPKHHWLARSVVEEIKLIDKVEMIYPDENKEFL